MEQFVEAPEIGGRGVFEPGSHLLGEGLDLECVAGAQSFGRHRG
ncbi:MAG: hypothetical protein ACJ789_14155 [Thermomicrobiales bacterium]